jgi:hypothetical protein
MLSLLTLVLAAAPLCFDAVGMTGPNVDGHWSEDRFKLTEFRTVLCVYGGGRGRMTFSITLPLKGGTKQVLESPDLTVLNEENADVVEFMTPIGPDGVRWKLREWKMRKQTVACKFDVLGKEAVCAYVGLPKDPGSPSGL